jgi:hypothetical protein
MPASVAPWWGRDHGMGRKTRRIASAVETGMRYRRLPQSLGIIPGTSSRLSYEQYYTDAAA